MGTEYWMNFGTANAGKVPTFLSYMRADTKVEVAQPAIIEIGFGWYSFEVAWASLAYTQISYVAECDGAEVAAKIDAGGIVATPALPVAAAAIANLALDHLHITQKINSLDDAGEPARAAKRWYDLLRRQLLNWPWRFATKRAALVLDTDAAHGHPAWAWAYTLPVGFFKGQGFLPYGFRDLPKECEIKFEAANTADGAVKVIYSDYYPSAQDAFAYTEDVSDVSKFSGGFTQALAAALAVKMAPALRVDDAIYKRCGGIWLGAWADARAEEETQGTTPQIDASWILARY